LLVNNAGISSCIVPAELTSASQFRRVFEVNLLGAFSNGKSFSAQ
jgi:NAD(P)-dependent dehydrogenase (short-subunit alcohol dehydrogenase family)